MKHIYITITIFLGLIGLSFARDIAQRTYQRQPVDVGTQRADTLQKQIALLTSEVNILKEKVRTLEASRPIGFTRTQDDRFVFAANGGIIEFGKYGEVQILADKKLTLKSPLGIDILSGARMNIQSGQDMDIDANRNLNIRTDNDMGIQSSRNMNINSGRDVSLQSEKNIAARSGFDFGVQSGRKMDIRSGTNMHILSGANMNIRASGALTQKGKKITSN